jgi:hypothetical protein
VASCIGYSFEEYVLLKAVYTVKDHAPRSPISVKRRSPIEEASDAGIIERSRGGYQFSHGKIQAIFQGMLSTVEEEECLHHAIREAFFTHESDESKIYETAAIHLNAVPQKSGADSDKKCRRLLRINIDAAKYCMSKSAFAVASSLLREGRGLVRQEDRWSE